MVISDLHLSNIRCFEQKTFRFSEGLNLVLGTNSSGKRTILDAIGCVLFGVGSSADLVGLPGNPALIEMRFLADGHAYKLSCSIDGAGNQELKLLLPDNGRAVDLPHKSGRLKSLVLGERTGPDLDHLFSSVLCLEDATLLRNLVEYSSFEKIFSLNRNYDAVLHGRKVYKSIKQQMSEDKSRILDSGAYRKKISKLKKELRDKEMAIKEKVRVLQFLSEQYHKVNAEFDDLESKKNRIDAFEEELELNSRAIAFVVAVREKNIEPAELKYIEEYRANYDKTLEWLNELEEMRIDRSILQKNLVGLRTEIAKIEKGGTGLEDLAKRQQKLKIYRAQLAKTESELLRYEELDRQIEEARAKKEYYDAANDRYAFLFDQRAVGTNGKSEELNLDDLEAEKRNVESELVRLKREFSDERHGVLYQKCFETAQRIEEEKFQLSGLESQKSSVLGSLKVKTDQLASLERLSVDLRSIHNSARFVRMANDLLTFLPQSTSVEIKAALQEAFVGAMPPPGFFTSALEQSATSVRSANSIFNRALFGALSESERALYSLLFHLSVIHVFFTKPGLFFAGKRFLSCFDPENRRRMLSFLSQAGRRKLQVFVFSREPVEDAPGHLVQI